MRIYRLPFILLLCGFILFQSIQSTAQEGKISSAKITLKFDKVSLKDALSRISKQSQIPIDYSESLVEGWSVTSDFKEINLATALELLLKDTNLDYFSDLKNNRITILYNSDGKNKIAGNAIIGGKVVDKKTKEPLVGVNVYISNSTLGSATDDNGEFTIFFVPEGDYKIIISHVGYTPEKHELLVDRPDEYYPLDIQLEESTERLNEVVVKGTKQKDWKKHLKTFEKEFIGRSRNAKKTKILNPFVLDFEVINPINYLSARPDDILRVENRALGYKLNLLVEKFVIQGEKFDMYYIPSYEKLVPKDEKELNKWKKERERAYYGSLRHFLTSVALNIHEEQGFVISRRKSEPGSDQKYVKNASMDSILFEGASDLEKILKFKGYLEITYKNEDTRIDYTAYMGRMSGQFSRIKLVEDKASFSIDGILRNPLAFQIEGYMAWERVADRLPYDYNPLKNYVSRGVITTDLPAASEEPVEHLQNPSISNSEKSITDYYAVGLTELRQGNWSNALNLWIEGRNSLFDEARVDPRIGVAIIRTVTERKLEHFYETAQEAYMWSFSQSDHAEQASIIEQEVKRLEPLLSEEMLNEWNNHIETDTDRAALAIRQFWIDKDPTPTTPYNERLIEHWQRIAFAKEEFDKNRNTPYESDDRGTILVKYGMPDQRYAGQFGTSYNPLESRGVDRRAVERFDWKPDYEIWMYNNINEKPEDKLIYMFGPKWGHASYGLRSGVEDFFNPDAFDGPEGMLMALWYYDQLTNIDPFFSDRFNDTNMLFEDFMTDLRSGNVLRVKSAINRVAAHTDANRMRDKNDPAKKYAPVDKSVYESVINPVSIVYAQTRILDDNNKPKLSVLAMSYPANVSSGYSLMHSLIIRDQDYQVVKTTKAQPAGNDDNTSLFFVDHNDSTFHYTLAARIVEQEKNPALASNVHIGKVILEERAPLDAAIDRLELSDLVIGTTLPDNIDSTNFPFALLPTTNIFVGDELHAYVEIYHLFFDTENQGKYAISYSIIGKTKKRTLLNLLTKIETKPIVTESFSYETLESVAKEKIAVDVSSLMPGEYMLKVEVKDLVSGQSKLRQDQFWVKELPSKK